MSYLNHNNITNRVGGTGVGSKAGQGIYTESSTAKFAIGEKLEFADGRVFRYGYTAAAISAGLLVSQDLSATSLVDTDNAVIAAASGFSPAAGSLQFQATLGSVTKDQYAGALLQVTTDVSAGVGEGIQYRIKSNSATGTTTSGKVDFYLYDPIKVTLTTASDIAIVGSLWYNVMAAEMIGIGGANPIISGVTPIAFTANYYGWLQTAGICVIQADGAIAAGVPVQLSDGEAGTVQTRDAVGEIRDLGISCYAADDNGYVGIVLTGVVP